MIGDRTRTIIIGVVTSIWVINFLSGLVVPGYTPDQAINGIFMVIVGGLFAIGRSKKEDETDRKPVNKVDAPEEVE